MPKFLSEPFAACSMNDETDRTQRSGHERLASDELDRFVMFAVVAFLNRGPT